MEQKKSEFDKVLGAWDILVIAFGAMIGRNTEAGRNKPWNRKNQNLTKY